MKRCPTCKRTYADDHFTFCLDDGSLLSAPFDPLATLPVGQARDTDPPRTEVLPAELPSKTLSAGMPPPPVVHPPSPSFSKQDAGRQRVRSWIALSATLALLMIGLIGLVIYLALRSNKQSTTEPATLISSSQTNSNVSTNSIPANVNHTNAQPVNRVAQVSAPLENSLDWLNGVWEGRGYQSNTQTSWNLRLAVQDGSYLIDYPSIPCGGRWVLINKNPEGARFGEQITRNVPRCENNSRITVKKISDSQASCTYFSTQLRKVVATAIINKRN